MSRLDILAVPKLRRSLRRASRIICQSSCEAILLGLPRSLQRRLVWLEEGLPYQEFIRELKSSGDVPEPFSAWEYYAQPILRSLPRLKRKDSETRIYCYESPSYTFLSTELAIRVATLTFRAMASSAWDPEDWRKVLREETQASREAEDDEVDYIGSIVVKHGDTLCLTGFHGESYGEKLRSRGLKVQCSYLDLPYQFLPLEALKAEFEREDGALPEGRIREFVSYHAEYVRDFVLCRRTLDDAYFKWKNKHRELTPQLDPRDRNC